MQRGKEQEEVGLCGPSPRHHRGVRSRRLYARGELPALPGDPASANRPASDWAHRCACATAAVRGMRRSAAFGQAVATDRCERRGLGTKGLTMTSETEPTASELES